MIDENWLEGHILGYDPLHISPWPCTTELGGILFWINTVKLLWLLSENSMCMIEISELLKCITLMEPTKSLIILRNDGPESKHTNIL